MIIRRRGMGWSLAVAALAFACGSSSAGTAGGSAGTGGASGASGAGGSGGTSGNGLITCTTVGVTGSAPSCDYHTSTFKCGPAEKEGTCPEKGLVGCCILSGIVLAPDKAAGSCYYDATSADREKGDCGGTGMNWITTLPTLP